MQRILLACLLFAIFAGSAALMRTSAQQPAADPEASRFTGQSAPLDAGGAVAGRRRFEPGARTAWHSHPRGQLLFVQEGRARIQKKGQPFKDFGPGESDFTGPDIVHWHGATPSSPLVHVAVGFGGETKWLDKVTDDEYAGRSK